MSEGGDSYDPGPWAGYDYKSAWAAYDDTPKPSTSFGSSYSYADDKPKAKSVKISLDDLVPKTISTNARSPVVILTDGTGSMGEFPKVIFEKLPLLDLGIKDYLDDVEISVAMIGDAYCDKYPLQVRPFTKGTGLVDALGNLQIESGGGSGAEESYDLGALYYARNCDMPKATKPVLIFIGDEGIYKSIESSQAKDWARVDSPPAKSADLFKELQQKFSVYCIRKSYGHDGKSNFTSAQDQKIQQQWESYIGSDRIAILNDPRRVVDVIFGLLAYETNKEGFFKKELTERQKPEQVETVMKSMLTIGKSRKALPPGKSVLKK